MDKIEKLMKVLGVSEEEAWEIHKHDLAVEKGADPYPLTAEQKQAEKKARQADRAPTVYKFQKRERKADEAKRFLIEALVGGISDSCAVPVEIANPEREFSFMFDGKKYKVVLSAPRS